MPGTVTAPRRSDGLAWADEEAAAERNGFVSERGCTDLGRVRVTAERLG